MDYKKYKEAKPGIREETTVKSLKEGKQEDFRMDGYWENVKQKNNESDEDFAQRVTDAKKSPALNVVCANGANMVINLPSGETISPRSNLAKWKNTYGDYPQEGQKVTTKTDENGFPKVVLESV